jgi:hypothetical protein
MSDLAYTVKPRVDPTDVIRQWVLDRRAALTVGGHLANGTLLDKNVGTEIPTTGLVGRVPFVFISGFGGDTDRFGGLYDAEISVFADTYSKASALALGLEAGLLGYPFRVSTGGRSVLVDRVTVPVPFAELEWQKDSPIRRFQGTVQISIRR